jgi:hypothetical protein
MSKPKIPVEVQVILQELCIAPADEATLLRKVHTRAALQVHDYLSIMLSKFELNVCANTPLAETIDDTRRILERVEHREHAAEEHDEADVVVHERA